MASPAVASAVSPAPPAEVGQFLDYKTIERGITEPTRQSYRAALCEFFAFLDCAPAEATQAEIQLYISSCYARNRTARTVHHRLCVLREFFKFLQIEGRIGRNPMDHIELPRFGKSLPGFMSEVEVYKLIEAPARNHTPWLNALALRDRAICETFYASGLRVSELTSARLCDLNLEGGTLKVLGKGGKERVTPLGRPAIQTLQAYLDAGRPLLEKKFKTSPYLFLGTRTPVLTRQAICNLLRKRAKRAGIPHVHPHMLRHSAATHMMNHGANLRVIQEILGHADISTTEIYTHVSQENVRAILLRCHPRNNPKRAQISLFQTAPAIPVPVSMPCEECSKPAARGKRRCEHHLRMNNASYARAKKTSAASGMGLRLRLLTSI